MPKGKQPAAPLLVCLLTLSGGCATYDAPVDERSTRSFGPAQFGHDHRSVRTHDSADGVAEGLIVFYQRHMRAPTMPGHGCPFHPSCSEYARHAYQRYGIFGGTVLSFDRLLIRSHLYSDDYYPTHCDEDRCPRRHDPVP
jgi:hypothetical protein